MSVTLASSNHKQPSMVTNIASTAKLTAVQALESNLTNSTQQPLWG